MKRLLLIIPVIILLLAMVSPALADDPPDGDVNVDIGISTGGDANVDVDVNAGGDANINVNGNNLNDLATNQDVQDSLYGLPGTGTSSRGCIDTQDWWRYYYQYLVPVFSQLKALSDNNTVNLDLAMSAIVKLIGSDNLTRADIETIKGGLEFISRAVNNNDKLRVDADTALWNQLMYGAEAHLSILQAKVDGQGGELEDLQVRADELQSEVDALKGELAQVRSDHANLVGYIEFLKTRYLLFGGIAVAFSVLVSVVLVFTRKRK
jgi:hypothetical protein